MKLSSPNPKVGQSFNIRINKDSMNTCNSNDANTTKAEFNGVIFDLNQIITGGMESRGYNTQYTTIHNGWCYTASLQALWSKYDEATYNPQTGSQLNDVNLDLEDQKVRGAEIMRSFTFLN